MPPIFQPAALLAGAVIRLPALPGPQEDWVVVAAHLQKLFEVPPSQAMLTKWKQGPWWKESLPAESTQPCPTAEHSFPNREP